jgi:hypothetical protein
MIWVKRLIIVLLLFCFLIALYLFIQLKDRHPDYNLDLAYQSSQESSIYAGFDATVITPLVPDEWIDKNNNARFDEDEEWVDKNNNGIFDPVWIAGFHNNRPAQGVNDDLWARTVVVQIGDFTFSWTVLDLIGYTNDQIISIRKQIKKELPIDYVIIASTHTHEGPDVLGMWGPSNFTSGIDKDYVDFINDQVVESVKKAFHKKEASYVSFSEDKDGAAYLVEDSRPPFVIDPSLKMVQFQNASRNTTLGTIVYWSNHPETTWSENLLITSDFVHYLREGIEKGIRSPVDNVIYKGLGGTCLFVNGSIGGLMTTSPDFPIQSVFSDSILLEAPSFAKAEAQGLRLAMLAHNAISNSSESIKSSELTVRAKSIEIPLDNKLYRLAAALNIFDRGLTGWWKMRSEVAYLSFGPAEFLFHPAEIYPEIVIGGVESPANADLDDTILETPPLIDLMSKPYKFVCGLSNDMIGYVIPTSQWDADAPYTYGKESSHYGEINSCGPESAAVLYESLKSVISPE